MTRAVFAPHHRAPQPPGRQALARDARDAREAIVLGAGLAGAACALAWLTKAWLSPWSMPCLPQAAGASSGNPAGLFHGTLNPDDGPHARFNRAAALATQALLKRLGLPLRAAGLCCAWSWPATWRRYGRTRAGLPATYVQALAAPEASALAGIPLAQAAWHYHPAAARWRPALHVVAMLGASGRRALNTSVPRCASAAPPGNFCAPMAACWPRPASGPGWRPCAARFARRDRPRAGRRAHRAARGQISRVAPAPARLGTALAATAGAIDAGPEGFWCGATTQDADPDPQLRAADHVDNLARLTRLLEPGCARHGGGRPSSAGDCQRPTGCP